MVDGPQTRLSCEMSSFIVRAQNSTQIQLWMAINRIIMQNLTLYKIQQSQYSLNINKIKSISHQIWETKFQVGQ